VAGFGIKIKVDGDIKGWVDSLNDATKATTGFSIPAIAGIAGVAGIAVEAGAKIAEFTKAAAEDRAEQEKLETVYKNTGAAVGDYTGQIDAAIQAGQDKAYSDTEVRGALQDLVTATGDATEANKLLGPAMDIARFAGVDLETASKAVAKAQAGQDSQLRKLMPGLAKGKDATATLAEATKLAAGSADDYASSSEGMGKKGSIAFSELTESIGAAFLPILDALMPVLIQLIDALGAIIKAILPVLIPIIKILATVISTLLGVIVNLLGWLIPKLVPALNAVGDVLNNAVTGFQKIIDMIKGVIDWVSKLIDALGKIKVPDIKLPSLPSLPFTAGVQAAAGISQFSAGSSGGGGSYGGVNIYISGDPATIERTVIDALRTYSRRNGISIAGVS
jgi:hypothetical protein